MRKFTNIILIIVLISSSFSYLLASPTNLNISPPDSAIGLIDKLDSDIDSLREKIEQNRKALSETEERIKRAQKKGIEQLKKQRQMAAANINRYDRELKIRAEARERINALISSESDPDVLGQWAREIGVRKRLLETEEEIIKQRVEQLRAQIRRSQLSTKEFAEIQNSLIGETRKLEKTHEMLADLEGRRLGLSERAEILRKGGSPAEIEKALVEQEKKIRKWLDEKLRIPGRQLGRRGSLGILSEKEAKAVEEAVEKVSDTAKLNKLGRTWRVIRIGGKVIVIGAIITETGLFIYNLYTFEGDVWKKMFYAADQLTHIPFTSELGISETLLKSPTGLYKEGIAKTIRRIEELQQCLDTYEGSGQAYCAYEGLFGRKIVVFIDNEKEAKEIRQGLEFYGRSLERQLERLEEFNQ